MSDTWAKAKLGMFLGFPLDQLLDKRCPCLVKNREQDRDILKGKIDPIQGTGIPGILLPTEDHPGTGTIIICGEPGTGKSTLALQIAVACTEQRLNSMATTAYVSLESSVEDLMAKAEPFGWKEEIHHLRHLAHVDQATSASELAEQLRLVLTQPQQPEIPCPMNDDDCGHTCPSHKNDPIVPHVIACTLSPRPIHGSRPNGTLFDTRFRQMQTLLAAARELRISEDKKPEAPAILPLVVVDSLNMFGTGPLDREEIHQLFGLFRRYRTIGVFVVETSHDTPFDSTMADVVIRLTATEDNGYFVRHFEVEKSRYVNQVNGKHPFKTTSQSEEKIKTPSGPEEEIETPLIYFQDKLPRPQTPRKGVVVFPSLHYLFLRLEDPEHMKKTVDDSPWKDPGAHWGIPAMKHIISGNLRRGSVIAVEGPRGAYKTNLAMSFLAAGLARDESCMLVALRDRPLLTAVEDSKKIRRLQGTILGEKLDLDDMHMWGETANESRKWQALIESRKAVISVSSKIKMESNIEKVGDIDSSACLFEVDFRSGALMAEEMILLLFDIIIRRPNKDANGKDRRIKRIVLDDVGEIGVGYPFLRKSQTSGDLFLPTLAHVMRNHGIDLIVTGTTGDLPESDDAIGRIRAVADAVVKCSFCDVFGQQHVLIQGIAATSVGEDSQGQTNCATVVRTNKGFKLDTELLSGLVGVGTGHPYRPGVTLQLYQESGRLHREYNKRVLGMVSTRFCAPAINQAVGLKGKRAAGELTAGKGAIHLMPFRVSYSESVHDALRVLEKDEPFDTTVIRTVDEVKDNKFEEFAKFIGTEPAQINALLRQRHEPETDLKQVRPYYDNVLLVAYDPTKVRLPEGDITWLDLLSAVSQDSKGNRKFWIDLSARETMSCALLDALLTDPKMKIESLSQQLNTGTPGLTPLQIAAVNALHNLLHENQWKHLPDDRESPDFEKCSKEQRRLKRELPEDAGVYICWYTQLRDLLQRYPKLSEKMKVRALPNGGFTGDWMIGVVRGSVSASLGSTIVDSLCDVKEQNKRYIMGVGLPVNRKGFSGTNLPAWPCATVPLDEILKIHDHKAKHRGSIAHYPVIRSLISAAAMELSPVSGGNKMDMDTVKKAIKDLFSQTKELVQAQYRQFAEAQLQALGLKMASKLTVHATNYPAPPVNAQTLDQAITEYTQAGKAFCSAQVAGTQDAAMNALDSKDAALDAMVNVLNCNLKYAGLTISGEDTNTILEAPGQCRMLEAVQQGEGWVYLDWKEPADGGTVTYYTVQRRECPNGQYEDVATAVESACILNQQPRGKELEYCVWAVNKAGNAASNTVMVKL